MVAKRIFVIAMGNKSYYICLFLAIFFFSHVCTGENKGNIRPGTEKSKTSSARKRQAIVLPKAGKAFKDSLALKEYPKSLERNAVYKAGDKINISYATLKNISKKRSRQNSAAGLSKLSVAQDKLKNNSVASNGEIPAWLAKLNKKETKPKTSTASDQFDGIKHISFIINQHNSEIQNCYHDYLKRSPGVQGQMIVRIIVNKMGQVDQVTIKDTDIKDNDFKNRIINIIKKWDDLGQDNPGKKVYLQEYVFGK